MGGRCGVCSSWQTAHSLPSKAAQFANRLTITQTKGVTPLAPIKTSTAIDATQRSLRRSHDEVHKRSTTFMKTIRRTASHDNGQSTAELYSMLAGDSICYRQSDHMTSTSASANNCRKLRGGRHTTTLYGVSHPFLLREELACSTLLGLYIRRGTFSACRRRTASSSQETLPQC